MTRDFVVDGLVKKSEIDGNERDRTMSTMSRTYPDHARAPPRTKREQIVRAATLDRGINMTDLAEKMNVTPQGLLAMLRAPRPRNETIAKLVEGLRFIGVKVAPTDLV